jgi:long-chain acyl-CoA synthetase
MIYEALRGVARRHRDRVAVVTGRETATYGSLLARADALADTLTRTGGVGASDTVLVLLPNSTDFVALFVAIARLGAVCMPIDPALTDREIGAYLRRFHIHTAVIPAAFERERRGALAGLTEQRRLSIEALPRGIGPSNPDRRGGPFEGVVAAVSTSGSTGSPRVVGRTQRGLLAGFASLARAVQVVPEDRVLGVVPFRHSHGLANAMLLSLMSGATLVVMERFLPRRLIDIVAEHRVSLLVGSPFIFSTVAECVQGRSAFATVRAALSSGAAVPPGTARAFLERTGVSIRELYGSSETGVIAVGDPDEAPGTRSARPVQGVDVRVVDDAGAALPPGATGEVLVRSEIMAAGYLGEHDGRFPLRYGFYATGDLGHVDRRGNLVLEGRTSLRLNIAGVKVDPVEIERVILELPQVKNVVVSSVLGERGMELIKASLVLAEGRELAREAVIAHCRGQLAEYKVPRIVEVVDTLPANIMGKRVTGPDS